MMTDNDLEFGVVKVTRGKHKGRVGYYDDDDTERTACVYFGHAMYARGYRIIRRQYLAPVTSDELLERYLVLSRGLAFPIANRTPDDVLAEYLPELTLIDAALGDRMWHARTTPEIGKRVFLSHSSKDKQFVRCLAVDLATAGHTPWLDEWDIRVGESIPQKVSEAIDECSAIIVVLSKHAVTSRWVENEWQAKYLAEIQTGAVKILPVLHEECQIPTLLRAKKYADFTNGYRDGLEDVLLALKA